MTYEGDVGGITGDSNAGAQRNGIPRELENALHTVPIWRADQIRGIREIQGGWTNRTYRLDLDRRSYVLRLNGEGTDVLGMDRQQEHGIAKLAGEWRVSPGVAYCNATEGIMVTDYVAGRHLSPDEAAQPRNIKRLAHALRTIHSLPGTWAPFCPFQKALQWLAAARQRGIGVPDEFDAIEQIIEPVKESANASTFSVCLCHNDFVLPNILDRFGLYVVDWEHAGTGNPLFDLAALATNGQLSPESEGLLLASYFEKGQPPPRSALVPWKRAFDFLNGAFYVLKGALSGPRLDCARGVHHHFSRLARDLKTN